MIEAARVVAIVQARLGSTRLPGKVLSPLAGRPMIEHVVRRAAAVARVHEVVVAVPDRTEDDPLAMVVAELGVRVMRGPEDDVLARYAQASKWAGADVVVRITSDCPMLSPIVSGRVLAALVDCDYASNTLQRTFPRGLDTEALTAEVLRVADAEARDPVEREHVTPFVYRHPDRFRLRAVVDEVDRSDLRWTVDTADDLAMASAVYDELGVDFEMDDVLRLLADRPEIGLLNRGSAQKGLGV